VILHRRKQHPHSQRLHRHRLQQVILMMIFRFDR
jgi:hypothetical protein